MQAESQATPYGTLKVAGNFAGIDAGGRVVELGWQVGVLPSIPFPAEQSQAYDYQMHALAPRRHSVLFNTRAHMF